MSETLAREAGIHEFQCQKEPFLELNTILEALRRRDLEPALAWAADHRDLLNSQVLSQCPPLPLPGTSLPPVSDSSPFPFPTHRCQAPHPGFWWQPFPSLKIEKKKVKKFHVLKG